MENLPPAYSRQHWWMIFVSPWIVPWTWWLSCTWHRMWSGVQCELCAALSLAKRVRRCEEWVQKQHSRHAQPASFVSFLRPFPQRSEQLRQDLVHSTGTNANHKQAISTSFSPGTSFWWWCNNFVWILVSFGERLKNNQKQSKKHQIKTSCTHLAVNILWVLKSPATFTAVNATRPASETALGVRLTSQLRWSKIRRSKRCWQHQYKLAKLRQSMIIAAKHAMFVILCTSSSAMPYECHMVSLQGSFADDSLIYESLLCLLVSFESFAIICMSSIGLPLGHQYTRALTSAKFVQNQNRSNSRHL